MPFGMSSRVSGPSPWTAAAALVVLAAGCGGETTAPPEDDATPGAGAVQVTVSGLPDGIDAAIMMLGDDGFMRRITGSGVVRGVPEGSCLFTARPVGIAPDETLLVLVPVRTIPVFADDTTFVSIAYEAPLQHDGMFTVFHGPLAFQGARRADTFTPLGSHGQPPTVESEIDTYSLPYPTGYVIDACGITGTDVTANGISMGTSMSGSFGSALADAFLVVDDRSSVTITASACASASASSAFVGNGTTTGVLHLGDPDDNGLYDACIVIDNPGGRNFELEIRWSYRGSVRNTEYASWRQRFVYQIDPLVCAPNGSPTELFRALDSAGPDTDTGGVSIPMTGLRHVFAFGMQSEASGNWSADPVGLGGDGSAWCTGSVTISVRKKEDGAQDPPTRRLRIASDPRP
jgi:hypothetical protein